MTLCTQGFAPLALDQPNQPDTTCLTFECLPLCLGEISARAVSLRPLPGLVGLCAGAAPAGVLWPAAGAHSAAILRPRA